MTFMKAQTQTWIYWIILALAVALLFILFAEKTILNSLKVMVKPA